MKPIKPRRQGSTVIHGRLPIGLGCVLLLGLVLLIPSAQAQGPNELESGPHSIDAEIVTGSLVDDHFSSVVLSQDESEAERPSLESESLTLSLDDIRNVTGTSKWQLAKTDIAEEEGIVKEVAKTFECSLSILPGECGVLSSSVDLPSAAFTLPLQLIPVVDDFIRIEDLSAQEWVDGLRQRFNDAERVPLEVAVEEPGEGGTRSVSVSASVGDLPSDRTDVSEIDHKRVIAFRLNGFVSIVTVSPRAEMEEKHLYTSILVDLAELQLKKLAKALLEAGIPLETEDGDDGEESEE